MRAMRAEKFSGHEALKLVDLPKPAVPTRNVLVRMTAAGATPLENTILSGHFLIAKAPLALGSDVLKRNSLRFAAALLAVLASLIVGPNAAAAQHHNQVPGFYGLKVGDLEVTALFDGPGGFDQHGVKGTKATMDEVVKALHEDAHMLDASETGFLVNTGKQLILVDAGSGTWWGGGAFGRLARSLRSAGYTPEQVDLVLVTHLHADHFGGLTAQDGTREFPNDKYYCASAEGGF